MGSGCLQGAGRYGGILLPPDSLQGPDPAEGQGEAAACWATQSSSLEPGEGARAAPESQGCVSWDSGMCVLGERDTALLSDPLRASGRAPLLLLPTCPWLSCSPLYPVTSFIGVHSKFAHSVCDAQRLYLVERDFLNYWSLQETPPLPHTAPGQLRTNTMAEEPFWPGLCGVLPFSNTPLPTARLQG